MPEFLKFYFVVEVLGIIIFPVTFCVFKTLSDKGLAFSKPVALIIVSYLLWIFSVFKIVPNTYSGIAGILFFIFIVSFLIFVKLRKEITDFVTEKFRKIIFIEVLFFVAFAGATYLRSFVPDIAGTEKPFEFMLFNSVLKSEFFPPYDAWYGGLSMSYYYFGYVILSIITILTKVSSSIAFNLGVSLTWALTAVSVFGLSYNIIQLFHENRKLVKNNEIGRVIFCLFIVFLFLIFSNFEGILEILAINGIGNTNFYAFFNVEGLQAHKISSSWYPTEHWFWWRATRLSSNWNVMEFPFFTFLLGDLHPHMLVLPYAVTIFGIFTILLMQKKVLNFDWMIKNPIFSLIIILIMGSIAGINTWFFIPFFTMLFLFILIKNYLIIGKRIFHLLKDTISFTLPAGVFSFFSFLPLFLTTNTSMSKVLPNELLNKASFMPKEAIASSLIQLFLFWGLLFLLALIVIIWQTVNYPIKKVWKPAVILSLLPWLAWCINIIYLRGFYDFIDELKERGFTLLSIVILTIFVALSFQALIRVIFSKKKTLWEGTLISAVSIFLGLLLILGSELFYIHDAMQGRYNTVFKFYFVAWMFLSIGTGIGIYEIWRDWFKEKIEFNILKLIVLFIFFGVIISSSFYPVMATFNRTNAFKNQISVDGMDYLQKSSPDEYAAILWLKQNVNGKQMIIEASGGDYSSDNLISAMTGLPTIIGMSNHEFVIHNDSTELQKRLSAVEKIYKTLDKEEARQLLKQYEVKYIYAGPREILKYGEPGLEKFKYLGKLAYKNDTVNIYKTAN